VTLVRIDLSEERIASVIRVKKSEARNNQQLLMFLTTANVAISLILSTLVMEAIRSSKTQVLTIAARRRIPEHGICNSHRSENHRSYV
jgi:hypothetical protein